MGATLTRSRRPLVLVVLVAWAIVLVLAGVVAVVRHDDSAPRAAPPQAADGDASTTLVTQPGDVVVAHLTGDGTTGTSATIHVDGKWQLHWTVAAGGAVDVVADDNGNQVVVASLTPGDGSLDVARGCDCTVRATPHGGAYDVTVVDVEG